MRGGTIKTSPSTDILEGFEPDDAVDDVDPRAELRSAHQEREIARNERGRLAGALERARIDLQRALDAERDRNAARDAETARFVTARAAALLEGHSGSEIAELTRLVSSTDTVDLELATARMVEEQLIEKLNKAEAEVRRAEGKVLDSAISLLVAHGEEMAHTLELGEAECRAKRASLVALAQLWTRNSGQTRPIRVGPTAHWVLTDGDHSQAEGITGLRAQLARQRGHVLPQELPPPDWQAVLNRLLIDPDADLDEA
jgi:hypothetical protein